MKFKVKNNWFNWIFLAALLITAAGMFVNAAPESAPPPPIYRPTITADTITNTENDTINLPAKLYTDFKYNWTVVTTQLSGTQEIMVILQESATDAGTDWYPVDTMTMTGAADLDRMVGAAVYGVRQRIIIDGGNDGAATQSTRYWVYPVFKYGAY